MRQELNAHITATALSTVTDTVDDKAHTSPATLSTPATTASPLVSANDIDDNEERVDVKESNSVVRAENEHYTLYIQHNHSRLERQDLGMPDYKHSSEESIKPFFEFSAQTWSTFAHNQDKVNLTEEELQRCLAFNDKISLEDVSNIYLPLSRLIRALTPRPR